MKFSILTLAVVSLATAQNLSGEPACASTCLVSAISVAGCKPSDVACQCGTGQPAIQTAVTPCLVSSCNASDLGIAAQVGLALCSVFSAGLNSTTTSTVASPTSTSTVVTTSSTPSSTASTSTTSVTAVTTSVPASTSSTSSSASSSAPAPVSSSGAASALVAGIGGAVGMFALVAAL